MKVIEPSKNQSCVVIDGEPVTFPDGVARDNTRSKPFRLVSFKVPGKDEVKFDILGAQSSEYETAYQKLNKPKAEALENAEHLQICLKRTLVQYFQENFSKAARLDLSADNFQAEIESKEFMQCRDLLSDLLKILKSQDKDMTRLFYKVILERNKYTHGVIHFTLDCTPFLLFRHQGKYVFGEFSAEHIKSFNDAVLDVSRWLLRLRLENIE